MIHRFTDCDDRQVEFTTGTTDGGGITLHVVVKSARGKVSASSRIILSSDEARVLSENLKPPRRSWVIRAVESDRDYWNNPLGWVARAEATVFSEEDRHVLRLPVGGQWEEVKRAELCGRPYRGVPCRLRPGHTGNHHNGRQSYPDSRVCG